MKNSNSKIQGEDLKNTDYELLACSLLTYSALFSYGFGWLSFPFFALLLNNLAIRMFALYHDRLHGNQKTRVPVVSFLAENVQIIFTPWDEPSYSRSEKHKLHHNAHLKSANMDEPIPHDHLIYQVTPWYKSFLACLIYEELQLYYDIKSKKISLKRFLRNIILFPITVLFIVSFGFEKFLLAFLVLRLSDTMTWWLNSWGTHSSLMYTPGFVEKLPKIIKNLIIIVFGKRGSSALFYHYAHHKLPGLRSKELEEYSVFLNKNLKHSEVS